MCTQARYPASNTRLPLPFRLCNFLQLLLLLFGVIQTKLQPYNPVFDSISTAFVNTPNSIPAYWAVEYNCRSYSQPSRACQTCFIWESFMRQPSTFSVIDFAEHTSCRALYTWIKDVRHHLFLFKLEFPEAFSLFGMQKHPEFKMKPLWPTDFHLHPHSTTANN